MAKYNSTNMLSQEDGEDISETLQLTVIPGMSKSIDNGLATSIEDCSEDPGW